MSIVDPIQENTPLENFSYKLEVEVAKLIREHLENSYLDFIGGNDLDVLIDTNIDIESIVNKALIERKSKWISK